MEVVLKPYPGITFKKVENDGVFSRFRHWSFWQRAEFAFRNRLRKFWLRDNMVSHHHLTQ